MVGAARATLRLFGMASLKDKRRIVRSVLDRLRNGFKVAAAEIAEQDNHGLAVFGLACVSADPVVAERVLGEVERWLVANAEGELLGFQRELVRGVAESWGQTERPG